MSKTAKGTIIGAIVGLVIWLVLASGSGGPCIVLANGGNKLCGDDARAWCDATDSLRGAASGPAGSVDESQRLCDQIRK